jgi:hypothetical protein
MKNLHGLTDNGKRAGTIKEIVYSDLILNPDQEAP